MATKYHVNDKGEPGICNAVHKCRFNASEEEHYDTAQEARAGYEKKMVEEIVPEGVKNAGKLSASKLNKVAKFTDDQTILLDAAQRGSSRVRASVVSNHNTGPEALRELYKTSTPNSEESKSILKHKNYPVEDLTKHQILPVMRQYFAGAEERVRIAGDDSIDDEKASVIQKLSAREIKTLSALAFNMNNKLSDEKRDEVINSEPYLITEAINKGYYGTDSLKKLNDNELQAQVYTRFPHLSNKKVIDGYVDEMIQRSPELPNSNWDKVVQNKNLPSKTIEKIVRSGAAGNSVEQFYYHKNTNEKIKQELEGAFPRVASIGKMQRATGTTSVAELKSELKQKEVVSNKLGTSYYAEQVQLDKQKIDKHGFTKSDVEALFGGGYNAGATYNPETGVFVGKIDSSG